MVKHIKSSYKILSAPGSAFTNHYKWIVVVILFIFGMVSFGLRFSFSVFFKSLQAEFGLSRTSISTVFSMYMLLSALFVIVGGWALDRYGEKKVFLLAGFFVSLSLMLTSRITASWQLFITYSFLFAVGTSSVYVNSMSTVSRWFPKSKGFALGIVTSGPSIGMIVFSPISAFLISHYGWRNSYSILSLIAFFTMIPCSLVLRKSHAKASPLPDDTNKEKVDNAYGLSPSQAVRMSSFWLMIGILFLLSACAYCVLTHIVPHAIDIGIDPIKAASMLSLIGLGGLLGRLGMGRASDSIGSKKGMLIAALLMGASVLWLMGSFNLWMLYVFSMIFGFAFGATAPLNAALIGDTFGLRHIGLIMAIIEIGWESGAAFGPALAGYIFDITGSYSKAFLATAIASFLGALLIILIKRPSGASK